MAYYLQFLDRIVLVCPSCQGACHRHAWYKRKINDGDSVVTIRILRVLCLSCRRTHAVLPDFLRPFGRYVQQVRETVVPCLTCGVPVEKTVRHGQAVETSRRWLSRLKKSLEPAASAMRSILAQFRRIAVQSRGSPLSRLAGLYREADAALGGVRHSCFFGALNAILSLGDTGIWL